METPQSQTTPLTLTEDDFQLFADRYRKPLKKHLNLWELLPKEIEEYILEYNIIPYLHQINESNKLYLTQYYQHRKPVCRPTITEYDDDLIEVDKNKKFKIVKKIYNQFAYKLYRQYFVRTNEFTAWIDYTEPCGFEYREDFTYYYVTENYLYWTNVVNPNNSREMLMRYCDLNNIRYRPKTGHKFLVKWLKECVE